LFVEFAGEALDRFGFELVGGAVLVVVDGFESTTTNQQAAMMVNLFETTWIWIELIKH